MGRGLLLESKPRCLQDTKWMPGLHGVGLLRQIEDQIYEGSRLADEKPVLNKTVDRIRRGYLYRTDHRAMRQFRIDEFARDREDQVGLEQRVDGHVEVRKRQPI